MQGHELGGVIAHALDQITDFAVIIDGTGSVAYANPFSMHLLGYGHDDLAGRSITEVVHPEDLERAIVAMARMDGDDDVPVTPAFYRLRRSDGSWCRIELNGTRVTDADTGVAHLVVFGRYSGDHDLQDRLMDLITSGAPADEVVALVPELGNWRHAGIHYGVFYLDEAGEPRAVGSETLLALGDLADPMAPWATVAATGDDRLCAVEDLPPAFTARARAAGVTHVWGRPVRDPLHGTHAVVAFARRQGGAQPHVHQYALDIMARVLSLVLVWRDQVVQLRSAARQDPLTGAANRAGFWEVLDGARRGGDRLAVLYVDLDGFKQVNDDHGHTVGDHVLAEVARRLGRVVRPDDVVARIGGDEFAVVVRHLGARSDAEALGGRIVAALAEPYEAGGLMVRLGASVGIATAEGADVDPDHLLERADAALYRAKAAGRGRWQLDDDAA